MNGCNASSSSTANVVSFPTIAMLQFDELSSASCRHAEMACGSNGFAFGGGEVCRLSGDVQRNAAIAPGARPDSERDGNGAWRGAGSLGCDAGSVECHAGVRHACRACTDGAAALCVL
eukprot:365329-Chlamydomonas_euryale.AAC.17